MSILNSIFKTFYEPGILAEYVKYQIPAGEALSLPITVDKGYLGATQLNVDFTTGINLKGNSLTLTLSKGEFGEPLNGSQTTVNFGDLDWTDFDRQSFKLFQKDGTAPATQIFVPTEGGNFHLNFYLHETGNADIRFDLFPIDIFVQIVNRIPSQVQAPGDLPATSNAPGAPPAEGKAKGKKKIDPLVKAAGLALGAAAFAKAKGALGGLDACGPAAALAGLADAIDIIDDKIDELIEESPLGKLNELKAEAEAAINGTLDAVQQLIPEIGLGIVDGLIPEEMKGLQDAVGDIAGMVLAGAAAEDALLGQLDSMKEKFEGVDFGEFKDLDDVVGALRRGSLEVGKICEMIPNLVPDAGGVGFTLKGIPTKFPEIDPVAFLKSGKLPDFPKFELDLDVEAITKEVTDDFVQFDVPRIRVGGGG
tara:strand:- start:17135 stop:18400 length:1266 start_codon:yes stop_codon:yes gene_type:complete